MNRILVISINKCNYLNLFSDYLKLEKGLIVMSNCNIHETSLAYPL